MDGLDALLGDAAGRRRAGGQGFKSQREREREMEREKEKEKPGFNWQVCVCVCVCVCVRVCTSGMCMYVCG